MRAIYRNLWRFDSFLFTSAGRRFDLSAEMGTYNIISKAQRNKAQRHFE